LLHDGRALVADFGIALAVSAAAGGRMTETGLSLGTPHYMSPEQATAEKDLTNRSDIYSLGAVLYEMLTGDPPHTGASAQQIIMKIVTEEAQPVTKARKSVPPHVAAAVATALEKLPADRFGSADDLAKALRDATFSTAAVSAAAREVSGRSWRRTSVVLAGVSLVLLLAVVVLAARGAPTPPRDVSRFVVDLQGEPGAGLAAFRDQGPGIAITDDGGWLAYPGGAGSRTQIHLRKRDRLDAESVRSTGDVRCCLTFAPDGQSLAYITIPLELKVVSLAGGIVRLVADSGLQDPSLYGGGVDWGPDGRLYVSMVDGLWRMSPEGAESERMTTTQPGERTHAWVDVLPNARGALLTVIPTESGDRTAYAIGVVDFATREVEVLFPGVFARYAASGHIVFVQDDGTLLVAPFDQDRLAVTGTPVAVIENVPVGRYGAVPLAMSRTGTLVYRRAPRAIDRLAWVARDGAMQDDVAPELAGVISTPRLNHDGTRFVVGRDTGEGVHLWTRGVAGGEPIRHTFAGQLNWRVNWSPVGDSLYFISDREVGASVFVTQVDGAGIPQHVPLPERRPIFEVLPVDDTTMVVRTDNQASGNGDILLVRLTADTTVTPLVATPAGEFTPAVSPDRQWLAYSSDESGANEVYVRPFPDVNARVYRVSTTGGTEPLWAHSGRELFYKNGDGDLVAAAVATTPAFSVRSQQVLFSSVDYSSNVFTPEYAISPDDQRFLMIRREEPELANEVVIVLNWFEELRQLEARE
jgi:serine/threonine-protein kinase